MQIIIQSFQSKRFSQRFQESLHDINKQGFKGLSQALNTTWTTSRFARSVVPSCITVSSFTEMLSPITTSLLRYVLSTSSFYRIYKTDCSLTKDPFFHLASLFMMLITHWGGEDGTAIRKESCSAKKRKKERKKNNNKKTLHWLPSGLKGKSANIEISIIKGLGYRALTGKIEPLQSEINVNKHPGRLCSLKSSFIHRHSHVLLCISFYEAQKEKKEIKIIDYVEHWA